MKKLILTSVIAILLAGTSFAKDYPEEYLGLPGDNLNLYAVMDLFRESPTLESFEKSLNDPNKVINNLDLNRDNYVDYIMVKNYVDGNVHNIVLSVAISASETQDVAVFIVEKLKDGSAYVQLIGDEALYGKNYIIEPNYDETPNPGYKGNAAPAEKVKVVTTTYYQVAAWPVVTYIYTPGYVVYYSPWYYGYYPGYWVPWTPYYYHYYYGYHYNWYSHYYGYYRPWHSCRYPRYHEYYYAGKRHGSPVVQGYVQNGYYKSTYSHPEEKSKGINHYERNRAAAAEQNTSTTTDRPRGSSNREAAPGNTRSERQTPVVRENRVPQKETPATRSNGSRTEPATSPRETPAVRQPNTPKAEKAPAAPSRREATAPAHSRNQKADRKESAPREKARTQESKPSGKSSERSNVGRENNSRNHSPAPSRSNNQGSKPSSKGGSSRESSSGRR
ncbi:MAG TPA: hypothetical protein P5228_02930 [Bacteroidales bacterium]|nr:hypothetical protein [Bacteroidales bacterium]HRZ49258.1 hypothetical protein [Bacteroidales bacterium]